MRALDPMVRMYLGDPPGKPDDFGWPLDRPARGRRIVVVDGICRAERNSKAQPED